jgi:tRNA pseudouridine55 synthase
MDKILNIYKPIGLTPFQLIEKLRAIEEKYQSAKIGYAGRLDPLAHGVMLLTIGEANFKRDQFLHLDKTYQIKILLGVETDSYDPLGLITSIGETMMPSAIEAKIKQFIRENTTAFDQPYPPFSSKPVNGQPLYKYAKKGNLGSIKIPTKKVEIYSIDLLGINSVSSDEIKKRIIKNLRLVKGHFRQTKTIKLWQEYFSQLEDTQMTEIELEISCSSGTYMRSLAHNLGIFLGTKAIATEIFRTKVGDFELKDSYRINK